MPINRYQLVLEENGSTRPELLYSIDRTTTLHYSICFSQNFFRFWLYLFFSKRG